MQKVEKYVKSVPLVSALVATGLAVYYTKKTTSGTQSKKESDDYDKIPYPEGSYYYLGIQCFFFLERFSKTYK